MLRDYGLEVLRIEAASIVAVAERLDDSFDQAVQAIVDCKGRVITTGIGKSGHIARKMSGTLTSTGTPSQFLHPADALHGDVGIVSDEELVFLFSFSGETEEVLALLPTLKHIGARLVAMTGRADSSLGRACDIVLDVSIEREACPHNLAPTASTTVMLAMGDALAIAAMRARDFQHDDFARYHPAGSLGRRLLLRVADVMRKGTELAIVEPDTTLIETISAITRAGAGAACVVGADGRLCGLVADGDIRRSLEKGLEPKTTRAEDVMTAKPTVLRGNPLAAEALEVFRALSAKVGELPVVDDAEHPVGMLMLKDLIRVGL